MTEHIPAKVMALAQHAKGNPIAWKEYPEKWVIVFEDGRKLHFEKDTKYPTPEVKAVKQIDLSDGVDNEEAALAGRALNKRKSQKGE